LESTPTRDACAIFEIPLDSCFLISMIVLIRGAINGEAFLKRALSYKILSFTFMCVGNAITMIYNLAQKQ
jgi:hypothetical protein